MRLALILLNNVVPKNAHLSQKELHKFRSFVGKDSKFLTNLRSQYIDKDVIMKKLERNEFEMKYNAARRNVLSPAILNLENTDMNNQIVQLLKQITPRSLADQDNKENFASYRTFFRYKKIVHTDIPPIPAVLTTETFHSYIQQLTTKYYTKKNASTEGNGIVVPLLKNLFNKDNEMLRFLRNVDAYNMVILYFLRLQDLDFALSLLRDMEAGYLIPNTTTYNSFLYHMTFHKTAYSVDPLVTTISLLVRMQKRNINADLTTWYLILKIVKKDAIFQKNLMNIYLKEFRLPKTSQLALITLENEQVTSEKLVMVLNSLMKYDISTDLIHQVLKILLREGKINQAWHELQRTVKAGFKPNSSTLQLFLENFQQNELIQLSLGGFYTFLNRPFKIKPSMSNFYSLILTTTKTGFHSNWRSMARIIYSEMERLQGTDRNKAGYWITRLQLRALTDRKNNCEKLDLKSSLTAKEQNLLTQIKNDLIWDDDIIVHPNESNDKNYQKLCKLVGVRFLCNSKTPKFTTTSEDKLVKDEFKNQVKGKNLSLNYLQRAKILAKGPLNHLVDELISRDIVPQTDNLEELGIGDTKKDNKKNNRHLKPSQRLI